MNSVKCRFCDNDLRHTFADLGMSTLSNAYLEKEDLGRMEPFYPLTVYVCQRCLLVQLPEFESPEQIFSNYAYFSSYSTSWLKHAENYVNMIMERFNINNNSLVIEIASND